MSDFNFNKIYVIESLEDNEIQTGTDLYNDLLKWQEYNNPNLKTELILINDELALYDAVSHITKEIREIGYLPMIHFEMHGNLKGMQLKSKEFISWNHIYEMLVEINTWSGNNLFLTLAVCYGGTLMSKIKIDEPAPFFGFIGSFEKLQTEDIMICYNNFYTEFLQSFNIPGALDSLRKSNPNLDSDYAYISSEDTFKYVYESYLENGFTEESIDSRAKEAADYQGLKFETITEFETYKSNFKEVLLATEDAFRKEHTEVFFMTKSHPENIERFSLKI